MATVTASGEILTLTTVRHPKEDQQDKKNPNNASISNGAARKQPKKYVHYSPSDRKAVVIPRVFQNKKAERDSQDHQNQTENENKKDDVAAALISYDDDDEHSYDLENDLKHDVEHDDDDDHSYDLFQDVKKDAKKDNRKNDEDGDQSYDLENDLKHDIEHDDDDTDDSYNILENVTKKLVKNADGVYEIISYAASPKALFDDVSINRSLSSKKSGHTRSYSSRKSHLSESTPIHFHEFDKFDDFNVSLKSTPKSEGDDLSETTPIKFHDSSVFFFDSDESSEESNGTPVKLRVSRRNLMTRGMSVADKKASQRFQSELMNKGMDEDAERDIVNVYLEASAFADRERINLTEDIYSFVLACSYFSAEFWIAIYFICIKYLCYGVIFSNLLKRKYEGESNAEPAVLATKLIMIPVAVAMQEDLITVYYNVANKKYDALTYKGNTYATESKWILCNLLRVIDGLMSLAVNFAVMLLNNDVLNIFLGFAALHFLQFIDDVVYELAEKGFFGNNMEQATIACKIITFTRRAHTANKFNNFITNLDTILLFSSVCVCYLVYMTFLGVFYADSENTLFGNNTATDDTDNDIILP